MKNNHSNRPFQKAFRTVYVLPVLTVVLGFVYYLIETDRDDTPVISKNIQPKTLSAVHKSPYEIEQRKVVSKQEPEPEPEPEPELELEPELDSEEQASIQNDYTGPLRELAPTDVQSQLLYEAEETLVRTCMNERGFEYIANPYVTKTEQEKLEPIPPKPGDIEAARIRGYGIAESIDFGIPSNNDSKESVNSDKEIKAENRDKTDPQADPNADLLANMSPEQQQAWNEALFGNMENDNVESSSEDGVIIGVEMPSGGEIRWDSNSCLSNARREIYDSSLKQVENQIATQALVNNIATVASQDEEFQGTLEAWRSCMLTNNLPYQYPGEAAIELQREYSEGKLDMDALQKKEIHYASIEAACLRQYSVVDAYITSEQRAEAKIRETEAEQINDLHAEFQKALISAERYAPSYTER
jgi:hypothetical protein